jgi:hypothetical protein
MNPEDKESLKHLINRFIMESNNYIHASAASANALFVYGPDDDYTRHKGDQSVIALDRYVKAQDALKQAVKKFL